ncbi:hypothetical protein PV08_08739 [Exophiala spinifera]|uniref:N-acetyltransferase domain-containing protein n=1 Tax=Exophiala spinifera TaxID=91928 RepID=A0A0D1YES3_9EURO|nr:uncharacterized protein PV08_08739 [Exophiala spinifera]KIW13551.1 hypothetical protein PV08_08739 [Exophiala spinifera]
MLTAQLVTTQPPPPPPPQPPTAEYSFNPHISSPTAVQLRPRSSDVANAVVKRTKQPPFKIRQATLADAPAIAKLGATVFSTTFGFSIPTADLNAYLHEAYSVGAIEDDIRSSQTHIIVACAEDEDDNVNNNDNDSGRVIGFAQLTEGTTEPCIEDLENIVELQRLYVDADHHGLGVGRALEREMEHMARLMAYRIVWLGVWEGNFKAQKVYETLGFTRVGEHEFKMGKCIQTDWIMIKDL